MWAPFPLSQTLLQFGWMPLTSNWDMRGAAAIADYLLDIHLSFWMLAAAVFCLYQWVILGEKLGRWAQAND